MDNLPTYNDLLAAHYHAYRPPLHELILERLLPVEDQFVVGLDVGCGTGYSARALARYCQHAHAIDPGYAMLSQAAEEVKISYQIGSAECIPLADQSVDIETYAGSLFYADLTVAASELKRVARAGAQVFVYDFAVVLAPFIAAHQLVVQEVEGYDHRCNFAGIKGFTKQAATVERVTFQVTASQLMHLLLSEPALYQAYRVRYRKQLPDEFLKQELLQTGTMFEI